MSRASPCSIPISPAGCRCSSSPSYGAEAARDLFRAVYGYWTPLPKDHRPRLYLHGLSLGAMSSEHSADLFEVIGDPYQGALWSGPPFTKPDLEPGHARPQSRARLTGCRASATARLSASPTSRMRSTLPARHGGRCASSICNMPSDPVTFFDYASWYHRPDWMRAPRGPDVSPELRWYPRGHVSSAVARSGDGHRQRRWAMAMSMRRSTTSTPGSR